MALLVSHFAFQHDSDTISIASILVLTDRSLKWYLISASNRLFYFWYNIWLQKLGLSIETIRTKFAMQLKLINYVLFDIYHLQRTNFCRCWFYWLTTSFNRLALLPCSYSWFEIHPRPSKDNFKNCSINHVGTWLMVVSSESNIWNLKSNWKFSRVSCKHAQMKRYTGVAFISALKVQDFEVTCSSEGKSEWFDP